MKLNPSEVELLSRIDSFRAMRKRKAWSSLATVLFLSAVFYFQDQLGEMQLGMLSALGVVALIHALRAQFEIGTENRLIDILRKYLNRDAETIEQLAKQGRSTPDEAPS